MNKQDEDPILPSRILLYLALISFLPLFAIQFGTGNQSEQFPIFARLLDPTFASNDFFLNDAAVLGQPRYYYAVFIAKLMSVAPLHVVIHALTVFTAFVLGLSTFLAGRQLIGAGVTGSALAATLAMLNHGFSMGYAGFLTFESFQPANIAIAAVIAGIVFLMLARVWLALACFILSSLFHPTIGAEIAVLAYGGVFVGLILTGQQGRLVSVALSGIVFIAGFAIAWVLPNMGSEGFRLTDEEFFAILVDFRAPHHYLGFSVGKRRWLEALLFLAAVGTVFLYAWRQQVPRQTLVAFALMIFAVVGLCALSLYFVDIAGNRLWATAQVLRNVLLAKWIGFLLLGWLAGRWLRTREPSLIVLGGLCLLPAMDALSYALILALATWAGLSVVKLRGWSALAATLPAVLLTFYHMDQFGAADQTLRIAVALAALWLVSLTPRALGAAAATTLVAGFLVLGHATRERGLLGQQVFQSGLTLADQTGDKFQIARLARDIGPNDAIWLVPPWMEQFRYVAGRAVVANFTSVPFTDAGLLEWHERMKSIYGESAGSGFKALSEMAAQYHENPRYQVARERYGAEYAVIHADTPWQGEVLAEAGEFKIIRIAQ